MIFTASFLLGLQRAIKIRGCRLSGDKMVYENRMEIGLERGVKKILILYAVLSVCFCTNVYVYVCRYLYVYVYM